jgi:hypothetical protein
MSKTNYIKNKKTARFNFSVARNATSHEAGANLLTIESRDYDVAGKGYSVGSSAPATMIMTVKEAKALNLFLTNTLS